MCAEACNGFVLNFSHLTFHRRFIYLFEGEERRAAFNCLGSRRVCIVPFSSGLTNDISSYTNPRCPETCESMWTWNADICWPLVLAFESWIIVIRSSFPLCFSYPSPLLKLFVLIASLTALGSVLLLVLILVLITRMGLWNLEVSIGIVLPRNSTHFCLFRAFFSPCSMHRLRNYVRALGESWKISMEAYQNQKPVLRKASSRAKRKSPSASCI